jgi:hypothetical protein
MGFKKWSTTSNLNYNFDEVIFCYFRRSVLQHSLFWQAWSVCANGSSTFGQKTLRSQTRWRQQELQGKFIWTVQRPKVGKIKRYLLVYMERYLEDQIQSVPDYPVEQTRLEARIEGKGCSVKIVINLLISLNTLSLIYDSILYLLLMSHVWTNVSYRILFDPLFSKKLSKIYKMPKLCKFLANLL